jgi:alpha,alpha-trehalose phosphorylase
MASLAGSWVAAVAGFGGFRDHAGSFSFDPRLPPHLERLAFGLVLRGRRLRVEIIPGEARYELLGGKPLELRHNHTDFTLEGGSPQTHAWRAPEAGDPPSQPPHRAPTRRRPRGSG